MLHFKCVPVVLAASISFDRFYSLWFESVSGHEENTMKLWFKQNKDTSHLITLSPSQWLKKEEVLCL